MKTLKELMALKEEADSVVDLQTFKGKNIPHSAWTDGVMYRGLNVYNTVYEGKGEKTIEAAIRLLKADFDGDLDYQESYLGYSPSKDLFIQGYDGWMEEDNPEYDEDDENSNEDETTRTNCSPAVFFTISDEGAIQIVSSDIDVGSGGKMWYGKGGGLAAMHRKYSDLIDIRLD